MDYENIPTEHLLDSLPQNIPLYKDSGLWMFRADDMEDVLCQQEVNESLRNFVIRYFKTHEENNDVMTDLSIKLFG